MKHTAPALASLVAPVWQSRADIPNAHGFAFVGLMHGNVEELCHVSRRADGTHTLARDAFPRLLKWRNLTDADTRRPLAQGWTYGNASSLSFCLLNQNAETRALIDLNRERSAITRELMGQRTSPGDAAAFRAYVRDVIAGKVQAPALGQFGPELVPVETAGPLIVEPLFAR